MPKRRGPSAASVSPERRRWIRLALAIPVFVRAKCRSREFLEFGTLLNESAGGALVAVREPLRRQSSISLEIPSAPPMMNVKLPGAVRMLRARVLRIAHVNNWNLCALRFAQPLI